MYRWKVSEDHLPNSLMIESSCPFCFNATAPEALIEWAPILSCWKPLSGVLPVAMAANWTKGLTALGRSCSTRPVESLYEQIGVSAGKPLRWCILQIAVLTGQKEEPGLEW